MKKSHLLLLFILLGTTLAQANNTKPKAVISNSLGTYVIEPGQTITFDGRASYDLDGGGIAAYHWFENGSTTHSSASPTFVKTYYSYGTFALKLRVTDHGNTYDEKTVTIQVRPSVAGTKYYITDHLGSVRSTVNHLGQVVGQEDFWSYGLTMPGRSWNNGNAYDRYKFTGVERDSEGGLELDAFGSRIYDPELGLFLGVDRFYHKYSHMSPYQYALNNPIKNIDINGDSVFVDKGSEGALAVLLETEVGRNIFSKLHENRKIKVTVTTVADLFNSEGKKLNGRTIPLAGEGDSITEFKVEIDANSANSERAELVNESGREDAGAAVTLAHELGHVETGYKSGRLFLAEWKHYKRNKVELPNSNSQMNEKRVKSAIQGLKPVEVKK